MTQQSEKHRFLDRSGARRIIAGLVFGGSVVVATAVLLPAKAPAPAPAARAAQPSPSYAWAQRIPEAQPAPEAEPLQVTEVEPLQAEPLEIDAQRPVVALETEDRETDHLAEAHRLVGEGNLRDAFTALRKQLYVKDPEAKTLLFLGRVGRELGELALAEQALLDAAGLEPTSAEVQLELARVLLDAQELTRARMAARQALRLDAEDATAWNLAGRIAMAQSEWARAEAAYRRALELAPMDPMVHNNLGLLYVYMRKGLDAVDALEAAVELYGDDDPPYFVFNNLGLAHELAGNLGEARAAFEEALVVNPFYARARVNLRRIEGAIAHREQRGGFTTARGVTVPELDLREEELGEE